MVPMKTRTAPSGDAVLADPRWRAVCARDAAADGAFVFAVRTTGVYCRPSCAARRPLPQNVAFYAEPAAARTAGYRACKRCRPEGASPQQTRARWIAALCRQLERADQPPTLAALAAQHAMSPSHLQRVFTRAVGLSPSAYCRAARARRLRDELAAGRSVTAALQNAGYTSPSRFYGGDDELGMPPKRARAGGAGQRLAVALADCTFGRVLVAATARGIAAILLGDDDEALRQDLARRFPRAVLHAPDHALHAKIAEVVAFVDADRADPGLPLDIQGTVFQRRVWQALRRIPQGRTASYAEIASRLGMPTAARAVARACADNPLAIAVPCHRVVRGDGALAGYRWGVASKRALLAREAAAVGSAAKSARKRIRE